MRRIARLARLGLAVFIIFGLVSRAPFAQTIWPITDDISTGIPLADGDNILDVAPGTYFLTGMITGTGANLIKQGQGELELYRFDGVIPITAVGAYTGNTTVEEGVLRLYDSSEINRRAQVTVQDTGILESLTVMRFGGSIEDASAVRVVNGGQLLVGTDLSFAAGADTVTDVMVQGPGSLVSVGIGGILTAGNSMYLGGAGSATMRVQDEGAVSIFQDLVLGSDAGGYGKLGIAGIGSTLSVGYDAMIGRGGNGVLAISEGATASIGNDLIVAGDSDSHGTVTIQGTGTEMAVVGNAIVGNGGTGELYVAEGALFTGVGNLTIGFQGSGTATVSGENTLVQFDAAIVGAQSNGSFDISDGGTVALTNSLILGDSPNVTGRVSIAAGGGPSLGGLTVGTDLIVGHAGHGFLNIYDQGTVTAEQLNVGQLRTPAVGGQPAGVAEGFAMIGGASASLQVGIAGATIGGAGTGKMLVHSGGQLLNDGALTIAADAGGRGNLTVLGTGSLATANGVFLGRATATGNLAAANGFLDVRNGGTLTNTGAMMIGEAGRGYVHVGTGSTISNTGIVTIGNGPATRGMLEGNGTVSAAQFVLGQGGTLSAGDAAGRIGVLTLDGPLDATAGSLLVDYIRDNPEDPTVRFDQINITGNATLGGDLYIDLTSLHSATASNPITVLTASGGITGAAPIAANIRVNGSSLAGSRGATAAASLAATIAGNNLNVTVGEAVANLNMTWNNQTDAMAVWDITTANWQGGEATTFFDGDAVTFNAGPEGQEVTINIEGTQRAVAQMTVTGANSWIFNGSILADGSNSNLADAAQKSGKLLINDHTGTTTLNGRNRFLGGIDISGGTPTVILGDDQALGVFRQNTAAGQSYNSPGQVSVYNGATATIGISANRMISNRFVLGRPQQGETEASNGNLTMNLGGRTLAIVGNTLQGQENGAAFSVMAGSTLQFSTGNLVLSDNTVTNGSGGALYYASTGTTTISNLASLTVTGNTAGSAGGGIYAAGTLQLQGNAQMTFVDNVSSVGGAITAGTVHLTGPALFQGNVTTGDYGGAIRSMNFGNATQTIIQGGVQFIDNYAAIFGGAISAPNDLIVYGNTLFKGNRAGSNGGAIDAWYDTTVTLNATGGDIIFIDNIAGTGDAAHKNAIHSDYTMVLILSGTNGIYFDDPVRNASTSTGNTMTVKMEPTGFVQFNGENFLNGEVGYSDPEALSISIESGTLRLVSGASIINYENNTFRLGERGVLAGGGTIDMRHGRIQLYGTLSPDSDIFDIPLDAATAIRPEVRASKRIGTLTIIGGADTDQRITFDRTKLLIDVDPAAVGQKSDLVLIEGDVVFTRGTTANRRSTIQVTGWELGTYDIVTSIGGTMTHDTADEGYLNYFDITVPEGTEFPVRGSAALKFSETGQNGLGETLQLVLEDHANLHVHWRGFNNVRTWEQAGETRSWVRNDLTTRLAFAEGDYVHFNQAGVTQGAITINADLAVAGMAIEGGTYLFRGGSISSIDPALVRGGSLVADETLTVSGGDATFENRTDFAQGVELKGGTVELRNSEAFGKFTDDPNRVEHRGQVRVSGDTTIRIAQANQVPVNNRFVVEPDATLLFDFRIGDDIPKTMTISGNTEDAAAPTPLDGGGIALHGDLAFSGAGTLIVEGNTVYGKGGGIYSSNRDGTPLAWGVLAFEGLDALTLRDNTAVSRDGAPGTGFGGGLYAEFDATLSGKVRILDNTADYGGGLALGSAVAGDAPLSAYTATLNIGGNTLFRGNRANRLGGAIYFAAPLEWNTLRFDTTDGDILFDDNRDSLATTQRPNAVYIRQKTDITITGGNVVYFNDPLDVSQTDLGLNTLTIDGGTTVQFLGDSMLNPTGRDGGTVTLDRGTLRLAAGGSFATYGNDATFTVNAPTATEAGGALAGNGTFIAEQGFLISGSLSPDGSILAPPRDTGGDDDLSGSGNPPVVAVPIGTLNFIGDMRLNRATLDIDLAGSTASDLINVTGAVSFTGGASTVNVKTLGDGVYTIMAASDGFQTNPNLVGNAFGLVTLLGQQIGDRMTSKLELTDLNGEGLATTLVLKLIQDGGSLDLVWTGNNGMTWNMSDVDWRYEDTPTKETTFNAGDYVIFDTTGEQGTITIAGDGVIVSGMDVRGGNYTFDGGEGTTIHGVRGADPSKAGARQTEQLWLGGGDDTRTVVTLNVATDFAQGTRLAGATVVLGNDRAFGSYAKSVQSGTVNVVESSTVRTREDRTIDNRFVVADRKSLRFDIAEGTTFTIGNINAADQNGGAISLSQNAMLAMRGGGGTLAITDSVAQNGGGIYGDATGTLNLSPLERATFTRNRALANGNLGGNGGGIHVDADLLLGRNNTFNRNQAQSDGGGMYVGRNLAIDAGALFTVNMTMDGSGGAIFAGGNVSIKGDSRFLDNTAGNLGGAIYMTGGSDADEKATLSLNTDDGDIIFSGNTHGGGEANSVYAQRHTDFRFSGAGNVFFDDPIRVGDDPSADGGNALTKTGTGFVQFVGMNVLNHSGATGGSVLVGEGTLRVVAEGDSVFATYGDDAVFTVAAKGRLAGGGMFVAEKGFDIAGTLAADAGRIASNGDGIIEGEAIGTLNLVGDVLLNNATLAVDLARVGDQDVADLIAVEGAVTLLGNKNGVNIGRWMNGTFDILLADGGIGDGTTPITDYFTRITVGGVELGMRQRAFVQLKPESNGTILQLTTESENLALTWTGAQSMVWNNSDVDWVERNTTTAQTFNPLDHVLFDGRGQGTITVAGDSVTSGGMIVTKGDYTFVGGDGATIFGVAKAYDGEFGSDGRLSISGAEVRFDVNTAFEGGIGIGPGATVSVSGTNKMSTDGELRVDRDATLRFDAADDKFTADSVRIDGNAVVNQADALEPGVQKRYVNVIRATGKDLDKESLSDTFTRTIALYGQTVDFTSARTMDLVYDSITLGQFAQYNHLSGNRESAAYGLNEAFHGGDMLDLERMLQQLETNEQVLDVLDQMRGTELVADALTLAFWKPWNHAFRMVDREHDRDRTTPLKIYRGQQAYRPAAQRNLWADTYHLDSDVDADDIANGYGVSRTGMSVGADISLTGANTVGIMLSYGQPQLYSSLGKVEMEDYTFAAFSKSYLNWGLEVYGFLAYGHQGYELQRTVLGERNSAHFSGDALYIAGKIVRPTPYNRILTFLPTIGLDTQVTTTATTQENGPLYGQRIQGNDLTRTTINLGLNTHWRVGDWATIDGRLQYARQITGDTYGKTWTTFNASPDGAPMLMRGVDVGPDTFNIGVGGQIFLNCRHSAVLFGDYDYEVGPKAYSQYVRLGISTMW